MHAGLQLGGLLRISTECRGVLLLLGRGPTIAMLRKQSTLFVSSCLLPPRTPSLKQVVCYPLVEVAAQGAACAPAWW